MLKIGFVPYNEFTRIRDANIEEFDKLRIVSAFCRLNTLSAVKKAGSGHLGSSFSALDIVVFLYFNEMNTLDLGIENPDRDIYFSSKGHECPGMYSVLFSAGIISYEKLLKLRRLGGLDGHPDIKIPGIEANSGSLGMGISKAKGMGLAKMLRGNEGRVIVMTGDGELQEGQIWESLQTTVHQKINNLHVIVDFNKIQTDKAVSEIIDLRDLERKFEVFGWHVERCDGHDFTKLSQVFKDFKGVTDRPKVLIADTVKGKGVSFMEGPTSLKSNGGLYQWHSGAPDDEAYEAGIRELVESANAELKRCGLDSLTLEEVETREKRRPKLKDSAEKVVTAYGEALVKLGEKREELIVLDADLSADCGLRPFENRFPERFVENGIAEQDMVSMAGGLALHGFLPVVNSFGVFLASRANEQIYANASEETKIIYVCHYSGLIPAGPGKSHQSLRDISLFGALPNCVILEPCNAEETRNVIEWCINEAKESCMVRLVISPSPRTILLPEGHTFKPGEGAVLTSGRDAVLFAYGPVMLHEALLASEILEERNISLKVVNMPWLNRLKSDWIENSVGECELIMTLDNHAPIGGFGDMMTSVVLGSEKLRNRKFRKLAVNGYPACGTPQEALKAHGIDGESLAHIVLKEVGSR
ncbi:MAG: 1-deoxy-D-xylulose-5-phosphate synthase [Candidatus Scalindua sp. AMX11]|nr:MAG: 1-deoxy-D-xylulose-5-phosphate synthase [Candidatus Scalindua sp.]NOG84151.1 1-deoxy-D-xylulose-5-phosphate synthase [Planctomycetota bacterium]RZV98942.1 MAG: 1-deoxy-D-xylulose-5-phosphate synthase [Candidatus Scalindua sp. SCAELEC01]TDE66867.1 MAG: 1-deoxy-D-xylulose-5-phosphate synthase [Candidatus Scalindua sp. AMX11]GJQ57668.1 MAG: transketolase [Candidatus Scalindua sp.]